jgi:hypothetical protein
MNGPSNIKIQKTGAVEVGNAKVRSPLILSVSWFRIKALYSSFDFMC